MLHSNIEQTGVEPVDYVHVPEGIKLPIIGGKAAKALRNRSPRRDDDRYMGLAHQPRTEAARSLVSALSMELTPSGRKRPTAKFQTALGAVIADLIITAAADPERYGFRRMGAGDFTGQAIGYDLFRRVTGALEQAGYITIHTGHWYGSNENDLKPRATCFRATPKLLTVARDHGVDGMWSFGFDRSRFDPAKVPPIALRARRVVPANQYVCRTKRIKGAKMAVDLPDSRVAPLAKQVRDYNEFIVRQDVWCPSVIAAPVMFHRLFSLGDDPDFDWNKGGRLYAIGGHYQQAAQAERKLIRINGEPVVELDIKASHTTILLAMNGTKISVGEDPYVIPGLPRAVAKAWVNITLGHSRYHTRWTPEAKADLADDHPDLQKAFPIRTVQEQVLEHLPVLRNWTESPIRWGDLQFVESNAVVGAVHELATVHGIAALPVHDSIIVPESKRALAERVLCDHFRKHVGTTPMLTTK